MNNEPFHVRVRREMDQSARLTIIREMLAMTVGGLLAAAVALAAWVIL